MSIKHGKALIESIETVTEELHLKNNIIIGSYPCSFRTIRSFAIPLAIIVFRKLYSWSKKTQNKENRHTMRQKKAYSYVRVSTKGQVKKGSGIARQRRAINKYCKANN